MLANHNATLAVAALQPLPPAGQGHPHAPPHATLTAHLPRDQALGLRLLVMARTAAALHMASTGPTTPAPEHAP